MRITSRRRKWVAAVAGATVAIALSSCVTSAPTADTPDDRTLPEHASDVLDEAASAPIPTRTESPWADDGHAHSELGAPEAIPAFGVPEREQALARAIAALSAFQDVGNPDWLPQLEQHLTAEARALYATVPPTSIPALKVSGVSLSEESTPSLAIAVAATDRGDLRIVLQRQPDLSWAAARFNLGELS